MEDDEMQTELELMVDKTNLRSVLQLLMNICFDKAQYLETNWQDESGANSWNRDGNRLEGWYTQVEN